MEAEVQRKKKGRAARVKRDVGLQGGISEGSVAETPSASNGNGRPADAAPSGIVLGGELQMIELADCEPIRAAQCAGQRARRARGRRFD